MDEARLESHPPSDLHVLTTVTAVKLDAAGTGKQEPLATQQSPYDATARNKATNRVGLQASNEAFYDDWLHRGQAETLRNMCHYLYGMYVRPKSRTAAASMQRPCFEFDPHYRKAKSFVQELLYSPEVPYLHGFTVPSKDQDMATNSLAHLVLFRPTRCPGDGCCRDAAAPSLVYIGEALCTGSSAKSSSVLHGVTKPSPGRSVTRGRRRFVEQWRAYEAHLQSLAERADIKIHRARKLAALTDITSEREWWCPGAEKVLWCSYGYCHGCWERGITFTEGPG